MAYPSLGVIGHFPTCVNNLNGFVVHAAAQTEVHFGPMVDFESDGNGGLCNWPPYDDDECFQDADAGLVAPDAYTISSGNVVTCNGQPGRGLGLPCTVVSWGPQLEIDVSNGSPATMYVNVLMDWNQDGVWGLGSNCSFGPTPEHVLVDFPVPSGFSGALSTLGPPDILIGPNLGYVWCRFTIGEVPVGAGWNGSHVFDLGETEDYLLRIGSPTPSDTPTPPGARFGLVLEEPAPNPFNPRTRIAFTLDTAAIVRLKVLDVAGRRVATLLDGELTAGRHQVTWDGVTDDGTGLPSGIYVVRVENGTEVRTVKVTLLK